MFRRIHRTLLVLATVVVAIPAAGLHAQERFRVLIPNFQPLDGADKKFGENAAKDLRELVAGWRRTSRSTRRRSRPTSSASR